MKVNLLINCLWYEDISPETLAATLSLSPNELFEKLFGHSEFTDEEIRLTVGLFGLTEEEMETIFFK